MCAAQRLRAKLPGGSASAPPILAQPGRQDTPSHPLASRVSFSESLCENPKIANRVPTGGQDRAPAKHSGPYSVSIRASPKGQIPTGPTFHTVWRVVRQPECHLITRYRATLSRYSSYGRPYFARHSFSSSTIWMW